MVLGWCSSSSPLVSDLCALKFPGKEDNVEIACHGLLTGIALHRATQHVQIAGILMIHGATQDYFPLVIKVLITHFIKSEKLQRYYRKKIFIE